jgi:hypothetical protein
MDLKHLEERVKKIKNKYLLVKIYNVLIKYKVDYTTNNNGIFCILNTIPEEGIKDINNIIDYYYYIKKIQKKLIKKNDNIKPIEEIIFVNNFFDYD